MPLGRKPPAAPEVRAAQPPAAALPLRPRPPGAERPVEPAPNKPREPQVAPPVVPLAAPADSNIINDDAILAALETGAAEILESGKAVVAETIWPNLDRKTCRVDIASVKSPAQTPEQLYKSTRQGTLILGAIRCRKDDRPPVLEYVGAAIVLTADGKAATNFHMMAPTWKKPKKADKPAIDFYVVMTHDGRVLPVTDVLAANEAQDVAIIQIAATDLTPLPLGRRPAVGAWVGIVSHPDFRFYSFHQGYVTRHYAAPTPVGKDIVETVWTTATCEISEGSSGGPAVDVSGNVVGMAAFTETVFALGSADERPKRADPLTTVIKPAETQMVVRSFVPVDVIRALVKP